ncbi:hypothetical protein BC938DRAFT_483879 [Jimgerdemannia flammicorona]|uniref:Uncharacterized protein n=1 Tax=Jimgerdemannia flammicorona TaxID=994334 RepID=A0A433QB61_9FUNG|nr:hypothetical protein BC938DRAFT_483879 [Jimgerdemannia flammicorona]
MRREVLGGSLSDQLQICDVPVGPLSCDNFSRDVITTQKVRTYMFANFPFRNMLTDKLKEKLIGADFWARPYESWGKFHEWKAFYRKIKPDFTIAECHEALSADLKVLMPFYQSTSDAARKLRSFSRALKNVDLRDENNPSPVALKKPKKRKIKAAVTEKESPLQHDAETSTWMLSPTPFPKLSSNADDLPPNPFQADPANETEMTEGERYKKIVEQIKRIQKDDGAARLNPMWWGVIDMRQKKVSPGPQLPRAKEFLSQGEPELVRGRANDIIIEECSLNKSCASFLEAISITDVASIHELGRKYRSRGIIGMSELLRADQAEDIEDLLQHLDEDDKDSGYVGDCFSAADTWVQNFSGGTRSERTVDMFLIGQFAKVPGTSFIYGENHSQADQYEKMSRSVEARIGKPCDFIFLARDQEIGCGENSGPECKDHIEKALMDFVDVIKVARAQHIALLTRCVEESGQNPLPALVRDACKLVSIPFFQVIGMRIRFYILLQLDGELYALWEWATEKLPTMDQDVEETLRLCKAFLYHRNLLCRVKKFEAIAVKKATRCRASVTTSEVVMQRITVVEKRTPAKSAKRKNLPAYESP